MNEVGGQLSEGDGKRLKVKHDDDEWVIEAADSTAGFASHGRSLVKRNNRAVANKDIGAGLQPLLALQWRR